MTEQENEQWRKRTLKATTECNQLTLGCKTTAQVARSQEFVEDTVCEV